MKESNALTEIFTIEPKKRGALDGLCFAVKDSINVAGHTVSNGHPAWKKTHPKAITHALCVEQLLLAGAKCVGIASCVELTFSIDGDNPLYGTPLNPKAPDRLPGGSSSGSASVVASGFADFSLGTDNTGSVRIPASHCGIWGMRPSPQAISLAGVIPFAPSFDTVGILSKDGEILHKVAIELLAEQNNKAKSPIHTIYLISEAFALADQEVIKAIEPLLARLKKSRGIQLKEISLAQIIPDPHATDLSFWSTGIIKPIQWFEIINSLGAWLDSVKPSLSPRIQANVDGARHINSSHLHQALEKWHTYFACLNQFIGPTDLLCVPTTPTLAPPIRELSNNAFMNDYYTRTFAMSALGCIGKLPEITIPSPSTPTGLSLLARTNNDLFLLEAINWI